MHSQPRRPQSAPRAGTRILGAEEVSLPVHHFAIRAQLRKKYGTAHMAWRVMAGKTPAGKTKTEVDRKTLYVGLYKAGIVLDQVRFEALWKLCDPEGSGLLTYAEFCSVFASFDASASLNRSAQRLRSGLRTKEGKYVGLSLEACIYDEADAEKGTCLTFEALERAVQRSKLNLDEDGIREVWNSCTAAAQPVPKLKATPELAFQQRQPFPDTGRGTCDGSRKLPLAGGLPTRPGRRVTQWKWLDKSGDASSSDPQVVQCALVIRMMRDMVASSLVFEGQQTFPPSVPVDLDKPAEEPSAEDIMRQWWGTYADASDKNSSGFHTRSQAN
eukprot:gnl/MRDRNA2_/MRDRNA2_127477_c0_seq1.p1 gnl/MRDRNA2_/MRDRNA2_127477_c0~~gnl/MRDRNA2_/MRDRNA2_127477_c0_seq1.p1  ORF type:complete len:329 (-),score=68.93 gnl/MRDRNA2_/MRDRNA2_127477_c0_seq1:512-1498(-)